MKHQTQMRFKEFRKQLVDYINIEQLLEWYTIKDNKDLSLISDLSNTIEENINELETNKEFIGLIDVILSKPEEYDKNIVIEAEILKERCARASQNHASNLLVKAKIQCERALKKARQEDNFDIVKPMLKEIIEIKRAECSGNYKELLSKRLNELAFDSVDNLFELLKNNSSLLIERNNKIDKTIIINKNIAQQILNELISLMNIKTSGLEIVNNQDSFMITFGTSNIKLALNLEEKDLITFLKVACHELGHVEYEQNNDVKNDDTFLSGAPTTAFDEGMAYFFEHFVGENPDFIKFLTKKYNLDVVERIHKVSPLRLKANSLEYPLHILIRYELEKGLMSGKLSVNDLKDAWREKYLKYLKINILNDNSGILQDQHWYISQLGYFPCYLIGRAYSSQIFREINKNFDFYKAIKNNSIDEIIQWLTENVYRYGASKKPNEILKSSTKQEFNPNCYLDDLLTR